MKRTSIHKLIAVTIVVMTVVLSIVAITSLRDSIRTRTTESTTYSTSTREPLIESLSEPESDYDRSHETTKSEWIEYTATAYCSCEKCCGKYALDRPVDETGKEIVHGSCGAKLVQGISIAADTSILPYGTEIEVENLGRFVVQDTGSKVKGNKIDIYFNNHDDASAFGRQNVRIRIINEEVDSH